MRKSLFLIIATAALLALAFYVSAQDAQPNSVTVSDQISLNGMVVVDSVTIDAPGFIAIHADEGGMPGHVVGIAPVPAGTSQSVVVMVDGAMATPTLYAELHVDDNTVGVFEFGHVPGADAPASDPVAFSAPAIVAFDQQTMSDMVVIASAISAVDGWLVVHADNGGQPGPVLGFTPIFAGTNAPVMVALDTANLTPVVWPMLHVDDGQVGTYEFDGQSGLDAPVIVNGVVATRAINLTDAPTLLLADGTPVQSAFIPGIVASSQDLAAGSDNSATLTLDTVTSAAQGFIDVHADMGHPAVSLGVTPVNEGENTDVSVTLMPPPEGSMLGITPTVWPMLHLDTDQDGEYRYLQIPGVDLPLVYNGAVVTVPVSVSGDMVVAPPMSGGGEATPEATAQMEPTSAGTGGGGEEATAEPGAEMTEEPTLVPGPEETAEPIPIPTVEVTTEAAGGE